MITSDSFSAGRRIALALGAVALIASTAVFAAPPVNTLKNSLFGGSTDITVREGKLYLNFDAGVQKQWLKDPAGVNKLADAKFPERLKKWSTPTAAAAAARHS